MTIYATHINIAQARLGEVTDILELVRAIGRPTLDQKTCELVIEFDIDAPDGPDLWDLHEQLQELQANLESYIPRPVIIPKPEKVQS